MLSANQNNNLRSNNHKTAGINNTFAMADIFFRNPSDSEHGFLSNAFPATFTNPLEQSSKVYSSAEDYCRSHSASDWCQAKMDALVKDALLLKFSQNPDLAAALFRTGDARLHLDSDDYWGGRPGGQDRLGQLLADVRAMLRTSHLGQRS